MLAGPADELLKMASSEEGLAGVKTLLSLDSPTPELSALGSKFRIMDFQRELEEEGLDEVALDLPMPDLDTVFTLSYTSGTTGQPKGAMLSHSNIVAGICGLAKLHEKYAEEFKQKKRSSLLFLPMAHILGRMGVFYFYLDGTAQGIFGGDITKLMEDIQLLKPTNFVGVPRMLNKIYDGVHFKMQQEGPEKYAFF